ncbi:MAG TPA: hypothetical protein VG983_03090 [Caulobacterales bacterium]|jgi:hypothetical protein|nr:hypothetical protein [Caulobacterales bacterium]
MSTPETPDGCKPPWQSLTLKGAIAMAIGFIAHSLGADAPDPAVQGVADALVNLCFYGGLLAVAIGRARARGPLG